MDINEFRRRGYEMIDCVADFMENIITRDPVPKCEPGYMRTLIPESANEYPESWEAIMKDIEPVIMAGMTHWHHPHFHAYFPSGSSWPSILGGILSNAFACNAASWEACPAATELEMITLDWCAKFLGLPDFFYSKFSNPISDGGGCIQTSASECVFISLIAAREEAILNLRDKDKHKNRRKSELKSLLIAYGTAESHSCFDKACIMADVKVRLLKPDSRGIVWARDLRKAIEEDQQKGYAPFFYNATLGSTSTCAFDDLVQLGPVCQKFGLWLHADAAYAGSSFCCPEMRYLCEGLEHWGIPTTRRFRALKLWCTIRNYGVNGIRNHIRNHIHLAKTFSTYVHRDVRFETVGLTQLGLCSFRIKGEGSKIDKINSYLLETLNSTHKIYMVPSSYLGKYIIRFAICSDFTTEADIEVAWAWISDYAEVLLRLMELQTLYLDANNNENEEVFSLAHMWKKYHKRPMNIQVLEQIKEYYYRKSKGFKDFVVESATQPAGSLASTADLKYLNARHPLGSSSAMFDHQTFSVIGKECDQPQVTVVDSAGFAFEVAGYQFEGDMDKIKNYDIHFWE